MAEIRITMKRVFRKGFLCLEIPEDEGIREALKRILTSCREKYNDFVQVTINPPYKPEQQAQAKDRADKGRNRAAGEKNTVSHIAL
jgi:hypothetical protein|nr:MAG TPA_asm: anticodon binding domain protein [Caudoviricetes sp.]